MVHEFSSPSTMAVMIYGGAQVCPPIPATMTSEIHHGRWGLDHTREHDHGIAHHGPWTSPTDFDNRVANRFWANLKERKKKHTGKLYTNIYNRNLGIGPYRKA